MPLASSVERQGMTTPLKTYLACVFVPVAQLVDLAVAAEEIGYDGVFLGDHIVHHTQTASPYPNRDDGRLPWDAQVEWADPFVTAGAIAARTSRLELMTGILILALRHPLLVAKAAATLDRISEGRLTLGVGAGWLREEFDALNQEFSSRGRRTDEAIEVLRQVLSGRPVEHRGEFFNFDELSMSPGLERRLPIYIGGASRAAMSRAARLGDGLVPPPAGLEQLRCQLRTVLQMRAEAGREMDGFEIVASAHAVADPSGLEALASIGVGAVRVDPFSQYAGKIGVAAPVMTSDDRRRCLERYMRDVIAPVVA